VDFWFNLIILHWSSSSSSSSSWLLPKLPTINISSQLIKSIKVNFLDSCKIAKSLRKSIAVKTVHAGVAFFCGSEIAEAVRKGVTFNLNIHVHRVDFAGAGLYHIVRNWSNALHLDVVFLFFRKFIFLKFFEKSGSKSF
jgi:hypothetical protein